MSFFQKDKVSIREEFIAKVTFDLFQDSNKENIFKKYNMELKEGISLFQKELSLIEKDKEKYKKYQDNLKILLKSLLSKKR